MKAGNQKMAICYQDSVRNYCAVRKWLDSYNLHVKAAPIVSDQLGSKKKKMIISKQE